MPIERARNMRTIDAKIIRGGSSKGVFIDIRDLPPAGAERDEVVLKVFGTPDRRQIDGLGGADKLTSKVAVMGPPTREDCDVDYLFGQVGTEMARIDWSSNCGNISSGAAMYGAMIGVGRVENGIAHVRVHQVNTGRQLRATVPMLDGAPAVDGDFAIGGVPGTGARIDLDFGDFAGSALSKGVLPTGNPRDVFDIPGLGKIEASVVDMANFHIFVRACDIGLDTSKSIYELQADDVLVGRLESVRKVVAAHLDFITGPNADEELQVSMNPLVYAVAEPVDYLTTNKEKVSADDQDVYSRSLSRYQFSKAYPGAGAAGTAVAAGLEGTLVREVFRNPPDRGAAYSARIGHPGGCLEVAAKVGSGPEGITIEQAVVGRTARLLMEGKAYIK